MTVIDHRAKDNPLNITFRGFFLPFFMKSEKRKSQSYKKDWLSVYHIISVMLVFHKFLKILPLHL